MARHSILAAAIACLGLWQLSAQAAVAVVGSLTREHDVRAGGSYSGSIEVLNAGDAPTEFRVYLTDYAFSADGAVLYGEPGGSPRSNARWVSYSPEQTRIAAGASVNVTYIVNVPDDTGLVGTYWSVLMVEPVVGGGDAGGTGSARPSLGIRQVLRYGVQLVTTFGTSGTRQIRFAQVRVATVEDAKHLVVDLENAGERALRAAVFAELYDSTGRRVGRFDANARRLYPGTSGRFDAVLEGLAPATYRALVVADCGGDDVYGVSVNLVIR